MPSRDQFKKTIAGVPKSLDTSDNFVEMRKASIVELGEHFARFLERNDPDGLFWVYYDEAWAASSDSPILSKEMLPYTAISYSQVREAIERCVRLGHLEEFRRVWFKDLGLKWKNRSIQLINI